MSGRARKELLILACAVDRVAWTELGRSSARRRSNPLSGDLLKTLELVGGFLPWRLGRWIRGVSFVAQLGRRFGWLG